MPAAELVLLGGSLRTMDPATPSASALAVADGKLVAIGSDHEIRPHISASTKVVDLAGATVVPGLKDGHSHVVQGTGLTLGVDLSGCDDVDAVRAALAGARPISGWIRAWGLQHSTFGGLPISSAPLEDVLGNFPAAIMFYDCHSILANRAAMSLAGIEESRQLPYGSIACDSDGQPTGHLIEPEAMSLVQALMPEPDDAQRNDAVRDVVRRMAAVGLTGAHLMDDLPGTVESLRAIDGEPGLRFLVYRVLQPEDGDDRIEQLIAEHGSGGQRWRFAGVKIWLDGTVEGGTSWLREGDALGQNMAGLWSDPERYTHAVRRLASAGVPTATHAIGDGAVGHVLDTLAGVPTEKRAWTSSRAHRDHHRARPGPFCRGRCRRFHAADPLHSEHQIGPLR